jgi:hypothetical protein
MKSLTGLLRRAGCTPGKDLLVNVSNVVVLTVMIGALLLMVQRLERRRFWLALLALLPGYMIYQWALLRGQTSEALTALGAAIAINLLFWLVYGRAHPPRSSDEITVRGMEDR